MMIYFLVVPTKIIIMTDLPVNNNPWQFSLRTLMLIITACAILISIAVAFPAYIQAIVFFVTMMILGLIYGMNPFISLLLLSGSVWVIFRWGIEQNASIYPYAPWPSRQMIQITFPASIGAYAVIYGIVTICRREMRLLSYKPLLGWKAVFAGIVFILSSIVFFYISFCILVYFGLSHM